MSNLTSTEQVTPNRDEPGAPAHAEIEVARKRVGPRLLGLGALVSVALAGALAAGTLPRLRQERDVNAAAAGVSAAPPRVTVAVAHSAAPSPERVLPGNALPLLEASLYPRATGYVKSREVDIGDRVQQGQ